MNLSDIRVEIDRVDQEIRKLFLERMSLAEQVVSVKAETGDKIYKPDREQDIILRNSKEVDRKLEQEYQSLIKGIMEVSRMYQYGRMLELRDCFPYSYEKEKLAYQKLLVLRDQMEYAQNYQAGEILPADSYDEMRERILRGEADAGIAMMEEIGAGINEEFHHMLTQGQTYINECIVTKGDHPGKCVLFSDHLISLADHNRCKIMFTCKNQAGSYASLLSIIADYGINFTEMHSSPFKCADSWDYLFFLELEGCLDQREMQSLIFQLSEETRTFAILGSYHCEGDFV